MRTKHLTLALTFLLTWAFYSPIYAADTPLDYVVAVVNDDVILASELDAEIQTIVARLRQQRQALPPDNILKSQVLERLILTKLQLQIAQRAGIRVDDETLNNAMRNIASKNNLSLRDFRQALTNEGIDYADFREQLREQIIVQQIKQRMVDSRIRVSDQEINNFLVTQKNNSATSERQVQLAQILVALPDAPSAEAVAAAQKKVDAIQQRIEAGEAFSDIAISTSDGRKALEGGDLGWFTMGQIPTFFAEVIGDLGEGDVSAPIRSPSGFHIVKIVDEKAQATRTVKQTKSRHILMIPDELNSEAAIRLKLETIRERILNGEDFAELAKASSADKGSAINGGDLGWASPGKFVPEFEEQLNQLSPGEISPVFKSRFGLHIIQLLDTRNYDDTEEYQRIQAANQIQRRKSIQEEAIWVRRLRDEAYVDIRLDQYQ